LKVGLVFITVVVLHGFTAPQHGSCPTCRNSFLDIRPPSESDDDSSDGGEYIPNEHEEEFDEDEDDIYIDTDGFSDPADFAAEPMELELSGWARDGEGSDADVEDEDMEDGTEWGLTDEDSSSMSEDGSDAALDADGGVGVGRWSRRGSGYALLRLMFFASLLFSIGNGRQRS
jgi:hypothetical protein